MSDTVLAYKHVVNIAQFKGFGVRLNVVSYRLLEDGSIKKDIDNYELLEGDKLEINNGEKKYQKVLERNIKSE